MQAAWQAAMNRKREAEEAMLKNPPDTVHLTPIHFKNEQLPEQVRGAWEGLLLFPSSFEANSTVLFRVSASP